MTSASDVDITNSTTFTVTLSGVDRYSVAALLNRDGVQADDIATNYNLAAAEDWAAGAEAAVNVVDTVGNGITVSNYTEPAIVSSTYDYGSSVITLTGTNFVNVLANNNDITANKFTVTGEGGATYTLTDTSNVDITSSTAASIALSATDALAVAALWNKDGTTSATSGTTYNLAAADNWMVGAPAATDIADATTGVTVSGFANPAITSATYDYSSGVLVVTGTNFVKQSGAINDVDLSKLTITGEGGATYTLTATANVEITSATNFSATLSGADIYNIEALLNKNGTTSATANTTFNLAAAEDWMAGAPAGNTIADTTGNGITVSNFANPSITSTTYDWSNGQLVLTGTNFVNASGGNNDIDVTRFTITGEGGATYTLTSSNVEITSATAATITLNGTDQLNVHGLLNKNGTTSATSGTTFNLSVADNWMVGSPAGNNIAEATVSITVSNIAAPTITSATYDVSTNALVVTGTNFVAKPSALNDIDVSMLTLTGEGGVAYTLTSATDVEVTSATEFTVTLSGADLTNVEALLNKDGTTADSGTTYNLAAADNWLAQTPAGDDITDATGNGITVSNYAAPSITSSTYDFATGVLVMTGSNFVSNGSGDDVDASKLTLTGEGGVTYTLTADTSNVNITSDTQITVTLGTTDQLNVNGLLNKNLTSSDDSTTYNLAAAEDWLTGAATSLTIEDGTTGINVSNYAAPTITSATYDSDSGVLVVTGTDFVSNPGASNDVDISLLTLTGGAANSTHTLTSSTDVEVTSATSFSITLSGGDKTSVDALLDQQGTSSTGGSTYNIAAADNWMTGAATSTNIEDLTTNAVTVQVNPKITSATYDATSGTLVVTGTNIEANGGGDDIDASLFTITGEGGTTYTLMGTSDVNRTSNTAFTLTLNATDKAAVNQLLNKAGTSATGGASFNLAAADDWNTQVTAGDTADVINAITVSNVPVPAITSATYDASTGALVVTGTNFLKRDGANNDIDISKLTLLGEDSSTHTLTSDSVEITSGTSFTVTLNTADKTAANLFLNKNGTSSTTATSYNLAAAEDWAAGADTAVTVVDATNAITVSNVPAPTISSAVYNSNTGVLVVTGADFVQQAGVTNDIDVTKLTLTGQASGTRTLTTSNVEITSATEFTVTLNAADKAAINLLLNKAGTASGDNSTYNLAAGEDWALGADAAVVLADLTLNGVTATLNTAPTSADTTESVPFNGSYTFTPADFGFTDPDTGAALSKVTIKTLPVDGDLTLNGSAITATDTDVSLADLNSGLLKFVPDTNGTGNAYATFNFTVNDGTDDSVTPNTVTLNVAAAPSSGGGSAPSPTNLVDGVSVVQSDSTDAFGDPVKIVTVSPVRSDRQDSDATSANADIPLHFNESDETVTTINLPTGIGFSAFANETARENNGLSDLITMINDVASIREVNTMADGGRSFLSLLASDNSNLWANKIVLTSNSSAPPDSPIGVQGSTTTQGREALVIDASSLPAGSVLNLQDVEFAVVIGPVSLTGGEGANIVYAGEGSQTIVLGADDDELHGGDGDDTVGSKGGDDLIFGDNGNDILFGGEGKDQLHGGRDHDVAKFEGNLADYDITVVNSVVSVSSKADSNDVDRLINVEQIQFADQRIALSYDSDLTALASLYGKVLNRQADLNGFQWWAESIDNGFSLGETAISIMRSDEFKNNTTIDVDQLSAADQVEALYHHLLDRSSDVAGKAYWLEDLSKGASLSDVAESFVQSSEMQQQYMAATSWDFMVS